MGQVFRDPALKANVRYPRGAVTMADYGPNASQSQFVLYIRDVYTPPINTMFGTIDPVGLAVLDKIAALGVSGNATSGPPNSPVTINSVRFD
jgi:peptidyl-prolyl cis-trans isomerase B (cyclophilin B)